MNKCVYQQHIIIYKNIQNIYKEIIKNKYVSDTITYIIYIYIYMIIKQISPSAQFSTKQQNVSYIYNYIEQSLT